MASEYAKLTDELKSKMKSEYVVGDANDEGFRRTKTIEQLAEENNVSINTLYKAAQRDGWREQKDNFQAEFEAEIEAQRIDEFAKESKALDSSSLNLAKAIFITVGNKIRANQESERSGEEGMTSSQLQSLSTASLNAQKLAKLALGEPTENTTINAKIAAYELQFTDDPED
tara:strand:+ start:369 stop:884 length:516 start_codon:yes stop_codon:yes gene_type:complete